MAFLKSQKFKPASLAARGELVAQAHYKNRGYKIFGQNIINSRGKRISELDFVAYNDSLIRFVEVKTRVASTDRFGGGRHAVDFYKQRKLIKMAKYFLLTNPYFRQLSPCIDIALVQLANLDNDQFCVTILPNAVIDD